MIWLRLNNIPVLNGTNLSKIYIWTIYVYYCIISEVVPLPVLYFPPHFVPNHIRIISRWASSTSWFQVVRNWVSNWYFQNLLLAHLWSLLVFCCNFPFNWNSSLFQDFKSGHRLWLICRQLFHRETQRMIPHKLYLIWYRRLWHHLAK